MTYLLFLPVPGTTGELTLSGKYPDLDSALAAAPADAQIEAREEGMSRIIRAASWPVDDPTR
jgi:hypothetical protein